MSFARVYQPLSRSLPSVLRPPSAPLYRLPVCQPRIHLQVRGKSNKPPSNIPRRTVSPQPPNAHLERTRPSRTEQPSPKIYFPKEDQGHEHIDEEGLPYVKVRFLRPTIWAIGVSTGIYVFLSFLDAKSQLKPPPAYRPHDRHLQGSPPGPLELASRIWAQSYPIDRLSYGLIATNGIVHLGSYLAPTFWRVLWHMPATNFNFTLFTSTFVHGGPVHLLVNMWACSNFLPTAGRSQLFEGNPYHTLAFFLSTGVLTGLAGHLTLMFKKKNVRAYVRSGGASGSLFAMFGIFCTQFPHAKVGILFLPVDWEAINFLPCVMLFDFIGMVWGYKFVNWGHAAHLSGALMGVGYTYIDGKARLWNPLVRFWKRRLQKE